MNWLKKFMIGRYGVDHLSIALLVFSFILSILFKFYPNKILTTLYIFIPFIAYYRTLSKNTYKRYAENQKFLVYWNQIKNKIKKIINKFKNRKNYRYLKCRNCNQKIRVPRGKGKIKITCPKCKETMIKKT